MNNKDYYIWLHLVNGIGSKTIDKLINKFGSLANLWESSPCELNRINFLNQKILKQLNQSKKIQIIEDYKKKLSKYNVQCIIRDDVNYPTSLKSIQDPPYLIYSKGSLVTDISNSIAIVGSRKASVYGKNIAYKFAKELAEHGITIISGMAYGIDSAAHKGALDGGGKTIAVLGCGIDICYPKSNQKLMNSIIEFSGVISEYSLGTQPHPGNFPQRNRIISGLSKSVLVIEASLKSGSLITVDHALDQGKDIFAIPGNILSSTSQGTNNLIKDGAKPITNITDILEEFHIQSSSFDNTNYKNIDLSNSETSILDIILNKQPIHVDLIAAISHMNISSLNSIITILEIKGIIEQLPGKIIITKKI